MTNLLSITKTLNAGAVDTVGRLSPTLQSQHNDIMGLLHYDGEAADYLEQNSCLHVFKEKNQVPTIYTLVDAFSSETVKMGLEDVDFAADENPKNDQLTQYYLGTSENVQKYVKILSSNKMSANALSVHRRSKDENIASTKLDLYYQVFQDEYGLNPDHQVLAQSPDEQDDPFYSTRQEPDGCEGLGDIATPDSRPTTLAEGHEAKTTNLLTLFKYQVFGRSAIQEQSENLVQPCVTDLNHSAKVGLTEEPQRMTSAMSEKAYREITMTEVLDVLPTTGRTTNHPWVTSEEDFCHPHVAARTKHETDAILAGDGQEEMKGEECRGEGLDGPCSDGAGDDRQSSRKQESGGQRSRQDCGQGNGQSQGAGGSSGGQSGSSGSGGDDEEDRKDKKRKDGKEDEEAEVSDEETSEEEDTQECFPDTEAEDDVSVTSEELSFTNRAVVEHRTQSQQTSRRFLQALSRNLQSINGIQTLHQGMDRPAIRYLNTLSTRLQNLCGQGGGLSVVPQKPPTRQLQDERSSLTRPRLLRRGTTVFESRQILVVGEDVVVVWLVRGILVDPNRQMLVLASVFLGSLGTAGTFAATLSGRHPYTLSHCLPLFFVLETPVVFYGMTERGNCLRMVTGPVEAGSVGGVVVREMERVFLPQAFVSPHRESAGAVPLPSQQRACRREVAHPRTPREGCHGELLLGGDVHTQPPVLKSTFGDVAQLKSPIPCTDDEERSPHRADGCGQAQVTQPSSPSDAEGSREVPLAESRDADSRNDSRRPQSCWGTLVQLNTPVPCTESVATVPVDGEDDVGATAETHVEDPKITAPPSRMAIRNRYSLHMPCTDDINEATVERLLRENQRLRRLRGCRCCQVLRFQAIIWPCRHLVCKVCLYYFWPSCPCCSARADGWYPARLD